jgi:hypothetical protein
MENNFIEECVSQSGLLSMYWGKKSGPVLNAENIKADSHKILRPTHFSCTKNIKADSFSALINIKAYMKKVNNKAENWQKPDKY